MSEYVFFSNGATEYSILKTFIPKSFQNLNSPVFCDFDAENLRLVVDYWRNNGNVCCTESLMYDLSRIELDLVTSPIGETQISIGNRLFRTTEATLLKIPYYAAAKRVQTKFTANIDRDPVYFQMLLSHCRHPLQHPLNRLKIPAVELAFYEMCPDKHLKLWRDTNDCDSSVSMFDRKNYDKNSMSLALNEMPDITLFINNYRRYCDFAKNIIFLEECKREKNAEHGDTVYFSTETADMKMVDLLNNLCVVCESDTEITNIEQVFKNARVTLYACNDDDVGKEYSVVAKFEKRPVKSRHAKIMHQRLVNYMPRNSVYEGVQHNSIFEFHDDTHDLATPVDAVVNNSHPDSEVTLSMSAQLLQCASDLQEESTCLMANQRANKHYITIPLHYHFSTSISGNAFSTLRCRFHLQLQLDGVSNEKLRLMMTTYQVTEDEHDAMVERSFEMLHPVYYTIFQERCTESMFEKNWIAAQPYSICYFLFQVRDQDSGERLACNIHGKVIIDDDELPFNIHTNQLNQRQVFGLKKYNPYIWVVPYCIKSSTTQPHGCYYVKSGSKMTIFVECDTNDVIVECWMNCYRVLRQKFIGNDALGGNAIGFLQDFDVANHKPTGDNHFPPPSSQSYYGTNTAAVPASQQDNDENDDSFPTTTTVAEYFDQADAENNSYFDWRTAFSK